MVAFYSILLIIVATMIGAVGALQLKKGAEKMKGIMLQKVFTLRIWIGLFLYGIASLITLFVLLRENVSIIYPLTAMSYIWVIILSKVYLKEQINAYKMFAIGFIILGIVFLTI